MESYHGACEPAPSTLFCMYIILYLEEIGIFLPIFGLKNDWKGNSVIRVRLRNVSDVMLNW